MNDEIRILLDYMVDPGDLTRRCVVPNPVRIRITDADSPLYAGILGESGRKMAQAGCLFLFNVNKANWLILHNVAERAE